MGNDLNRILGGVIGGAIRGATDGPGRSNGEIIGTNAGSAIQVIMNGGDPSTVALQKSSQAVQQMIRQQEIQAAREAKEADNARRAADANAARAQRIADIDAIRDAKHPAKPVAAAAEPQTVAYDHKNDLVQANNSFTDGEVKTHQQNIVRKVLDNDAGGFVHIDDLKDDPKFKTIDPDNTKLMQVGINGNYYGVIEQDYGDGSVSRRYITNDPKYKAEPAPAQKAAPVAVAADPAALDKSGVPSDIVFQKDADPSVPSPTSIKPEYDNKAGEPSIRQYADASVVFQKDADITVPSPKDITAPYNDVAVQTKFTDTAPEQKAAKTPAEDPRDHIDYTVKEGDSLWKIAREHYGIDKEDHKSIQIAVNAIAAKNGMDAEQANNIDVGQKIKLPDNPFGNKQAPDITPATMPTPASVVQSFNIDDNQRGLGIQNLQP